MFRDWRSSVVVALASLGLMVSACSSNNSSTPAGAVGPSYVHGEFQGSLASSLVQVFAPKKWSGQTDGPVLLSADKLLTLSEDQKVALRTVLSGGHAILLSEVTQEHLERLHALNKSLPAITLETSTAGPAALYVLARPGGRMRVLVVASSPDDGSGSAELAAAKTENARQVAEWFLKQRALHAARSNALTTRTRAEGDTYDTILGTDFPFGATLKRTMTVEYSDSCGAIQTCSDTHSVTISSVGVHNANPIDPSQPTDYIIAHLDGTFSSVNCKLKLGVQSGWQNNRWAGFWLRQANMSAAVHSPIVLQNGTTVDILDGAELWKGLYAPQAVQANTTYTEGMTVNLGVQGSVTGGVSKKDGPSVSGSVGVSVGVAYTNEKQSGPFPAVEIIPKIMADPDNLTKVGWSFDSWQHVIDYIKPANHGCGGPGLDVSSTGALPTEIHGGTMTRHAEWVWQLMPEVREALAALPPPEEPAVPALVYLPVDLRASVLLGWAFFPAGKPTYYCRMKSSSLGHFNMNFDSLYIDVVGTSPQQTSALNGLAFDTGCGTDVLFGTIPLGSWTANTRDGSNVGAPFELAVDAGVKTVNLPLAPDPYEMKVTDACVVVSDEECRGPPLSGPAGSVIRLTGKNLHTATSVEVGGLVASSSLRWPANMEPEIEVTAPYRQAPPDGTNTAAISVINVVTQKPSSFIFTYTN